MPKKLGHIDPVHSPAYSDQGRINHDRIFNKNTKDIKKDGKNGKNNRTSS